jgi:hypothetical protein
MSVSTVILIIVMALVVAIYVLTRDDDMYDD